MENTNRQPGYYRVKDKFYKEWEFAKWHADDGGYWTYNGFNIDDDREFSEIDPHPISAEPVKDQCHYSSGNYSKADCEDVCGPGCPEYGNPTAEPEAKETVDIQNCSACNRDHSGLEVLSMSGKGDHEKYNILYTICPTTKEEVFIVNKPVAPPVQREDKPNRYRYNYYTDHGYVVHDNGRPMNTIGDAEYIISLLRGVSQEDSEAAKALVSDLVTLNQALTWKDDIEKDLTIMKLCRSALEKARSMKTDF